VSNITVLEYRRQRRMLEHALRLITEAYTILLMMDTNP
jgi:hypothetical protein